MTITEIITAAKDIVLGIAAAITATIAILGLKSWRRELQGRAEFDAARGLARATYRLRDELASCRSPFIRAAEFPADSRGRDKSSPHEEADALAHVYKRRWEPVWKAIQEFDAQALEAESLWGKVIRGKTDILRACVSELNAGIEALIDNELSGGRDFESDRNFGREMRATVSASRSDKKNALSKKISDAVEDIENQLRPHLKRS
jgi:hypothetical protein